MSVSRMPTFRNRDFSSNPSSASASLSSASLSLSSPSLFRSSLSAVGWVGRATGTMRPFRYVALLFVVAAAAVLVSVAKAQYVDFCNEPLPGKLSVNYSGLSCRPVWNTFALRYSQGKDSSLRVVLSTVYTTGWVGMGFSGDGQMVGSSAIVGWIGKTGRAHIKQFYLGGQSPAKVKVNEGHLILAGASPEVLVEQAKIYLAFQLHFPGGISRRQNILLAFGSDIPVNNHLKIHEDKTSMAFNFATGDSGGSDYPSKLKAAHGALGVVAWGVLLPIGAIVARYCRKWDPLWFYLHVAIQFIGFILALAGIVAGVALYNKLHVSVSAHRGLGIFVFILAVLQIISFFLRPGVDSKIRKYWTWYHHWVGRIALFFAAINIVVGIKVGGAGISWKVGYGINLAILLLTTIVLEILMCTRWSRTKASPQPTF